MGGCSDKISREHVVSASLWESPAIDVVGFPWCKDVPERIGVSSLTAKILCRNHNTELSEVDAAGSAAFHAFRRSTAIRNKREAHQRKRWKVVRLELDGVRLERWFLKTLINLGASGANSGWWLFTGRPLAEPPREFIDAAFGRQPLQPPLGLYGVGARGEMIHSSDALEAMTLLDRSGALGGALFRFRGFRFFLNLAPGDVPKEALLPAGTEWVPSALLYHIRQINNRVGRKLSHYIQFNWQ